MKVIKIVDKYNSNKIWIIKIYSCGHYYVNQEICGRLFNRSFRRLTKSFIKSILDLSI